MKPHIHYICSRCPKQDMIGGNLYCKSCEHMDELKDNSVDLIVTSPPYWNARDYVAYLKDRRRNFKKRTDDSYEEFLGLMKRCFMECFRVLKRGRFFAVNISSILFRGKRYAIPFDLYFILKKIGFEMHQEIIWHKSITKTMDEKNIMPGQYFPHAVFEHIIVFRKPGPPIYFDRSNKEKNASAVDVDDFFRKEITYNVWHIFPVKPLTVDHPVPYPEELPYRIIQLYSYKGDLVLDPFLGSGTTAAVAKALERRYCGYDTQKEFIQYAEKRLALPVYRKGVVICRFKWNKKVLIRKR